MRRASPEEHHPAVVRRVRCVAASEQVDALADDVPLHQRVHRVGTCGGEQSWVENVERAGA